ncbi:hypothetical protein BJ508DRAFT_115284 [Ascobolus immersus RN42]|uniref:MINDY deubiquitinase domain-containing protein n=1 Tax=Ascobolus immersus RN42 TaxID=1160509 RepID=A0A3N4I524_ASCIM|nr:hypothetical protein BJ508DRAFT_115284 [Ascobolus immersus RN42]
MVMLIDWLVDSVAGLNVNPLQPQQTGTNPFQQAAPAQEGYGGSVSGSYPANNYSYPPPSSSPPSQTVNDPYSGLDSLDRAPQRNSNPFTSTGALPNQDDPFAPKKNPFAPTDANAPAVDPFWEKEDERFWNDDDDTANGPGAQQHRPAQRLEPMATGVSIQDFWEQEEERFGPVVIPPTVSVSVPKDSSMMNEDNLPTPVAPQPPTTGATSLQPLPESQPLSIPQQQSLLDAQHPPQAQGSPSAQSAHEVIQNVDEKYTIKQINWLDPTTPSNHGTRTSPIILQNENGPCPLIAVVNALVLSTPIGTQTPLIRELSIRETISLQLLLDTVFDELTSRSDGSADVDISEIFAFLTTLHTGMNVNPRFIPHEPTSKLGTFQQTRELDLYSKFGIPLVHGWLPRPGSETYEAFERSAKTFEDAQNLLIGEEEFLTQLSNPTPTLHNGIPIERTLQDLDLIKQFLSANPSQLTPYGLDVLRDNLSGIGIFFRNDHFATVMRLPTGLPHNRASGPVLLSLVTDTGFGSYAEVVWETLVSVRGEGGEFLSGDYLPVGGGPTQARQSTPGALSTTTNANAPADIDSDFALALSLQQEEDSLARRTSPPNRIRDPVRDSSRMPGSTTGPQRRSLPTQSNPNSLLNIGLADEPLPPYSASVGGNVGRPASTPLAGRRASVVERGREARGMLEEFGGASGGGLNGYPAGRPRAVSQGEVGAAPPVEGAKKKKDKKDCCIM